MLPLNHTNDFENNIIFSPSQKGNIPSHKALEDPRNRVLVNLAKAMMELLALMNFSQMNRFGNGS